MNICTFEHRRVDGCLFIFLDLMPSKVNLNQGAQCSCISHHVTHNKRIAVEHMDIACHIRNHTTNADRLPKTCLSARRLPIFFYPTLAANIMASLKQKGNRKKDLRHKSNNDCLPLNSCILFPFPS